MNTLPCMVPPIYANNTIAGVARWRFGDTSKGTYGEPCVRGNCCALARRPWKLCKVTRAPTTTTKKRHSPRLYLFAIEINGLRRWPKCASACDTRTWNGFGGDGNSHINLLSSEPFWPNASTTGLASTLSWKYACPNCGCCVEGFQRKTSRLTLILRVYLHIHSDCFLVGSLLV